MLLCGVFTVCLLIEISEAASGNTFYVGGTGPANYTSIQSAINDAANGDTIFVYNGIYYENVVVDKILDVIGENAENTIIDGGRSGDVVSISTNYVNLSNFTITNSSNISSNAGIKVSSSYNVIFNCTVYANDRNGIYLDHASNNTIFLNNIHNNTGDGINLSYSSNNTLKSNSVYNNTQYGIRLTSSSNNTIYHNSLINNTKNAYDDGNNSWDNGYPSGGNYWGDYTGDDNDDDEIGDTPYNISGGNNWDYYPFMNQDGWLNSPPIADAGGPYFAVVNVSITFDGSESSDIDGYIVSYNWDFGEEYGHFGQGITVPHTYTAIGNYTVTLTVTDNRGAIDTNVTTVTVSLNTPPIADAGGPYSAVVNSKITFDGSGSSDIDGTISNYSWDFGDGKSGTGISPSHTYTSPGKYTVTLSVTDSEGANNSDTISVTIKKESEKEETSDFGLFATIFIVVLIGLCCVAVFFFWKDKGFFRREEIEEELCPCPYCGCEISFESTKCPYCGKEFMDKPSD